MDETRLGSILLESKVIGEQDLEKCLEIQTITGHSRPLGQILIEQGLIDRPLLDRVLELQHGGEVGVRSRMRAEADGDGYLHTAVRAGARELVISEGRPALARAGSEWRTLSEEPLGGPEVWDFVRDEMGGKVLEELADRQFVVRDLHKPGLCRGRITALRHFDGVAAIVELRPEATPTADELGIPPQIVEIARGGRGLVLMVGERGQGRTEVMAAVLREVAADRDRYVIVLDDAIDSELPSGGGMVARRRVGEHVGSYASGLRTAVREDPDAILVGSVGEPEAFDMALRAAESGRLVVAWIDSCAVVGVLERILNFYPVYDVPRVRATLASVLRAVCVRFLLPSRRDQSQVPATELLLVDDPVRDVLRGGDLEQLELLMRLEGGANGHSLDQSMFGLLSAGRVRIEHAYARARDKAWLLERSRGLIDAEL